MWFNGRLLDNHITLLTILPGKWSLYRSHSPDQSAFFLYAPDTDA